MIVVDCGNSVGQVDYRVRVTVRLAAYAEASEDLLESFGALVEPAHRRVDPTDGTVCSSATADDWEARLS